MTLICAVSYLPLASRLSCESLILTSGLDHRLTTDRPSVSVSLTGPPSAVAKARHYLQSYLQGNRSRQSQRCQAGQKLPPNTASLMGRRDSPVGTPEHRLVEIGSSPIRRKTTTLNMDNSVGMTTPKKVDNFCGRLLDAFRRDTAGVRSTATPTGLERCSVSLTLVDKR